MIKVFEKGDGWDEKVNAVDDNNVFVGYDLGQCCCEHAGYFISDKIEDKRVDGIEEPNLSDYVFDPEFFHSWEPPEGVDDWDTGLESGGMVAFKMMSKSGPDLYLHLYNVHNGYYGHGFTMRIGEMMKRNGSI